MDSRVLDLGDSTFHQHVLDRLLYDFISQPEISMRTVREELQRYGVRLQFSFPTVALFDIRHDHRASADKRKCVAELRRALEAAKDRHWLVFNDDEGQIGVLFSWDDRCVLPDLQRHVHNWLSAPVAIAVGLPSNTLTDLHKSYGQAKRALQDVFYRGSASIVLYSELTPYQSDAGYPFDIENELYECIRSLADEQQVNGLVDRFFDSALRQGPVEIEELLDMVIRLMAGLEKRLTAETGKNGVSSSYSLISIIHMQTLDEVKRFVKSFARELKEGASRGGREIHHNVIKQTIEHMERDCQNVTLNSVAEKVFMTPTYLSLLFKMNTGRTFIEQLTDIRIQKAKTLLKSSNMKNYEVAEKVGYQDSRYFSQIFKKKVGLSPSEYRESSHL